MKSSFAPSSPLFKRLPRGWQHRFARRSVKGGHRFFFVVTFTLSLAFSRIGSAADLPDHHPAGYSLVFGDEFNVTALDRSRWCTRYAYAGGAP